MMRPYYLYMLVAMLAFVGCHKPMPAPDADAIETPKQSYDLSYEMQTLELAFATNAEYSFEISDGWITLVEDSRSQGMKSYTVQFAVEENNSKHERSAHIRIIAGDAEYIVTVVQAGMPERMLLLLDHANVTLNTPTWRGDSVTGNISWGDGATQKYVEGASHSFGGEEYQTKFDMRGATGFRIEQIDNIDNIEIGVEL